MKSIFIHNLLTQNDSLTYEIKKNTILKINEDGIITQILENQEFNSRYNDVYQFIIPGMVNSHSHAFQFSMRGIADNPKNFKDWVNTYLYPTVSGLNEISLRKIYQQFFSALLRNGITTLGEFHYLHHDKNTDTKFDNIFLEEAANSGIRVSLLYSAYDLGERSAQKRFHHSIDSYLEALASIEDWMKVQKLHNKWALSVAPHSLHGCSAELLRESVNWANSKKKYWHIHLSEQKHDIGHSISKYNTTPLFALQNILKDKFDDRICIVHGCWLTDDEIELFNENKINLIYNPLTNMYLGDGSTRTSKMDFISKSKVALGTDSNNAFNMFSEMKAFEFIQRLNAYEMGIIDPNIIFSSVNSFSGTLLNLKTGKLIESYFADFIDIDLKRSNINASLSELSVEQILNHLIFSGLDSASIKSVVIGGNKVA